MSDYKALVGHLRSWGSERPGPFDEAADAIEALMARVQELEEEVENADSARHEAGYE